MPCPSSSSRHVKKTYVIALRTIRATYIKGKMRAMIGKIRPQIFMALFMLALITGYAINADMVEIATGTVGGMVALGMKVLEND
jgi:hypothetical protein